MTQNSPEVLQEELNDLLEAYEHAREVEGAIDLRACLPRDGHPLFIEARRELVRLDLEYSWQNNCPKRLAVYLALFPDLLDDRETAQAVTFEEYRQRVLAGENPSSAEYERLYGVTTRQWPGSDSEIENYSKTVIAGQLEVENEETIVNRVLTPPMDWDMFEDAPTAVGARFTGLASKAAQALLRKGDSKTSEEVSFLLAEALTTLPEVGTRFLNFHLIAELGRGGFGRVYLARQSGLANRLVALKITVDLPGEEQKLAQLQHTNVVPIYSAHKAGQLHAVCMPYFGPTTLADVVRHCTAGSLSATGACLAETVYAREAEFSGYLGKLDISASASDERPIVPATLALLAKSSYVNAILNVAERVAEGLMHAHEHGILHGDLKPANILLTDEGQPMLLDFNLATDIKVRAGVGELRVGGTLPYMAPEHLAALQDGNKKHVDARSDIYAIGVILFELLTGRLPFEGKRGPLAETLPGMIAERLPAPPRLRHLNPGISPAVESIVRHCLAPKPADRYQTAEELHEDLQRHRHHLPLQHAPEPSMRERAQKWVRRHPRLASPPTFMLMLLLFLAAVLSPLVWQALVNRQAELEKAETDVVIANKKTDVLKKEVESAKAETEASRQYRVFSAKAAGTPEELMDALNLVRLRPETVTIEKERLQKLADQGRGLLNRYRVLESNDWQLAPNVHLLPDAEKHSLRGDMASILYPLAEIEIWKAERLIKGKSVDAHQAGFSGRIVEELIHANHIAATRFNRLALACFPTDAPPRALVLQHAELARLAGSVAEAKRLEDAAESTPLHKEAPDEYWVAAGWAIRGKQIDAAKVLAKVTRDQPDHFGAWRLRALCLQSTRDFLVAEACWNTCAALKPEDSWVLYFRGRAGLHLSNWKEAREDFDEFLENHPCFRDAYIYRAVALEGLGQYAKAIDDLTTAIDMGPAAPELMFKRVELKEKNEDRNGAQLDRIRLLAEEPTQLNEWIYRGMIQAKDDSKAALADLERALSIDPNNVTALYQKALLLDQPDPRHPLHRPKDAISTLNRLLIADPGHIDARLKRGLLYAKEGIRSKATADAKFALESDPSNPASSYAAACIYAFTSKEFPDDNLLVVKWLGSALRHGYGNDRVGNDVNLPISHIPEAVDLRWAAPFMGPARTIRNKP